VKLTLCVTFTLILITTNVCGQDNLFELESVEISKTSPGSAFFLSLGPQTWNELSYERQGNQSALWAAFLAAQSEIQQYHLRYRQRSALAVSTREKLNVSVGDALGFYASSLTVKLPQSPSVTFWDNARDVHARITRELTKTNLFRMLSSELIHPTLLNSLYFGKLGLAKGTR